MFRCLFALLVLGYASCAMAIPFASRYALVIEETSGKVLLSKNADIEVPIASLTKLMTAMVVLDSNPDLDELITVVDPAELTGARSKTRLTDGGMLPRRTVLELALISSDNHAAAALAYAYPGGVEAFVAAVAAKLSDLGMTRTRIEEPTGMSWNNRSTAEDLAKMAAAAAEYPEIERITTTSEKLVDVEGRTLEYRNTNRLIGQDGWDILLSKTGFTTPAGRCLIMRLKAGGQTAIVVLLNATSLPRRTLDVLNVRRFLTGEKILQAQAEPPARTTRARQRFAAKPRMAIMRTAAISPAIRRY